MARRRGRKGPIQRQVAPHELLLERLEIEMDHEALLHALTHRSYAHEHEGMANNERLEFLGDAVLEYVVTSHLYRRYPEHSEGDLVRLRASIVSTRALALIARRINLGEFILLGQGEINTKGYDKDSILADTMEAVFGALYINKGMESVDHLVQNLVLSLLDDQKSMTEAYDWKTLIQEFVHSSEHSSMHYQVEGEGPDHDRTFTATLMIDGTPYGSGTASSKREAEKRAAHASWKIIKPGDDPTHA